MQSAIHNLSSEQHHSIVHFDAQQWSNHDVAAQITKRILSEVMAFRRVLESAHVCDSATCQKCSSPHFSRILSFVEKNEPVIFVLPAFPGKSPNPEKVLGHLPDYAEQLSLKFLGNLNQKIKKFYAPGIKIIICSDGRVFSDIVGIKEVYITEYQQALDKMIETMSLSELSTFNLDDFYHGVHFTQMREDLMQTYGESLENLKNRIQHESESKNMYRGITRFLFEDAKHSHQTKSNTAIQKEARVKAYEVIRRSNAWSKLIAEYFPDAVRLSIHPQICGAKKLGIRLIGNESWMTPWHGVAVADKNGVFLMKRSEAEALGAQLMYFADGRPSHYRLERAA